MFKVPYRASEVPVWSLLTICWMTTIGFPAEQVLQSRHLYVFLVLLKAKQRQLSLKRPTFKPGRMISKESKFVKNVSKPLLKTVAGPVCRTLLLIQEEVF